MHFDQFRGIGGLSLEVVDAEVDGRCLRTVGDPPGRKSVYITPGDTKKETYRLSTFKNFPEHVMVNTYKLATSGFYYTGFSDRVKCFSCGQIVDCWVVGDEPESRDWHKDDCEFINGTDETNIPIMSLLRTLQNNSTQPNNARMSGSETKPSNTRSAHHFSRPPTAGEVVAFGHLPQSSRELSASAHQSTSISAQLRSPPPSVAASLRANEVDRDYRPRESNRNQDQDLHWLFPCLNPINPHMRSSEARLQTFLDHSTTWPSHRIRATPQDIADAGMYYLGERDRAKCWYCNGGLQNWDRDDNPWEEHAKWFPMCEFVLQQKGPDFVHRIVARYPNLRRPTLQNPASSTQAAQIARTSGSSSSRSTAATRRGGNAPEIIDPREEMRNRNKMIEREMMTSGLVSQAREMGFEDEEIKEALKRKYESSNQSFSSFESLVGAIIAITEEDHSDDDERSTSASENPSSSENRHSVSPLQEMKRLEDSRLCKVCRKDPSSMVFIPCGHLVCCITCGQEAERCPVCKTFIKEKVRSYLS